MLLQYTNPEKLASLSKKQQQAMLLAHEVRINMEDFHYKFLSDAQMKELNPLIRQEIMNGLELWSAYKRLKATMTPKGEISQYLGLALNMIQEYWEPPEENHYKRSIHQRKNNSDHI